MVMEEGRESASGMGEKEVQGAEDLEQNTQIEMSLGRLSNLLALFKEKVTALDRSVNLLEEKVTGYAAELAKAYKDIPRVEAADKN